MTGADAPGPSPQPGPQPGPRRRRAALRILALLAVIVAALAAWEVATWPDVAELAAEDPGKTAFMKRWERTSGGRVEWTPVPRSRIARSLQLAVLVAEDDAFFSHDGFSSAEIRKAVDEAIAERRAPRGASTITQQLAKNLWLSPSRNPLRKIREAILTRQLESNLEKERILELYLNVVELGPGVYGAEAAARRYFGKSASALGETEAAALAASLTRPASWHPGVQSRGYAGRQALILDRMRRWPWVLPPE